MTWLSPPCCWRYQEAPARTYEEVTSRGLGEDMRVGQGYDVHPFEAGRRLVLGGIAFEGEDGLAGHSDGDVLTHAVIDALLGASSQGDIGNHFPSSDERWKDADSVEMLREVSRGISNAGYRVGNVDVTVIAAGPRLTPHIVAIRHNLAMAMGIETGRVSVKATTTDGLGAIGRGEGIAVMAIALLEEVA
jgi:2-C-methyl-D-erythritol 2,4-cyclodiphosphate synthase